MEATAELSGVIGELMGRVLHREPLGPADDFFAAGGDSLRAIQVIENLGETDGVPAGLVTSDVQALLLEAIFEDSSPSALASALSSHA